MSDEYRGVTCAFTGYRPEKLPWGEDESSPACEALKTKLRDVCEALYESGIRVFVCGMARGCDTFFCEAALELRSRVPGVTVEAAIPCPEQSASWDERDRERYMRLCRECDSRTVISPKFTRSCMSERNRYMVDRASVLVAVYDGKPGGTASTVAYARSHDLEIILLNP